jgi:HEAT repeat protein
MVSGLRKKRTRWRAEVVMRGRAWLLLILSMPACGCGKGQKTTAELLADLKGSQERDRLVAVRLLPQRKAEAAEVVPALIDALTDKAVDIRLSAAIGLGSFGESAKAALPALKEALKDHDARVREAAGRALSRIDRSAGAQPNGSSRSGR